MSLPNMIVYMYLYVYVFFSIFFFFSFCHCCGCRFVLSFPADLVWQNIAPVHTEIEMDRCPSVIYGAVALALF